MNFEQIRHDSGRKLAFLNNLLNTEEISLNHLTHSKLVGSYEFISKY